MSKHRVSRRRAPVVLWVVAWGAAGCKEKGEAPVEPAAGPVPFELQTTREIAAALFADGDRMAEARAALEPLLHRKPLLAEDLLRAAAVEVELNHGDLARPLVEQAAKLGDSSARLHYLRARIAYRDGDLDAAQREFERAAELATDDLPTQLMIAKCRYERGEGDMEAPLKRVMALGADVAGSWYTTAVYRQSMVSVRKGRSQEAAKLTLEFSQLQSRGIVQATEAEMERGNFGRLDFPRPTPPERAAPPPLPAWAGGRIVAPEFAGATQLLACDLLDDGNIERNADKQPVAWRIGATDLVGAGPAGIVAAVQGADGGFTAKRLWEKPVARVVPFDFAQDGDLDFWAVGPDGLELLVAEGGALAKSKVALPPLRSPPLDLQVVDFDHEGDLDLILVGAFGARLWRDDGASKEGAFVDATQAAGLEGIAALDWCDVDDVDSDQDVDLLMGGAAGVVLADNQRGGKFARRDVPLSAGVDPRCAPVVADLDGDGRCDLGFGDASGALLLATPSGKWAATKAPPPAPPLVRVACAPCDANGDTELDLLRWDTPALGAVVSLGSKFQQGSNALADGSTSGPAVLFPSGRGPAGDLARVTPAGLELLAAPDGGAATSLRLSLLGKKDNRRGVGAIVEVRAGASYQRIHWAGEPQRVGLAGAKQADWVRITWPNGVIQSEMAIPAGADRILEQKEGLIGSCPFLYAWNGKTFAFVTDVLGVTPLGLPMRPGALVPPDHDEYVLVRGDQLVPRAGRLELQFTEELREVTYFDHVHLEAVDHPAAAEVFPDEKFTFSPFPAPRLHAVVAPLAPRRALGSDGREWTAQIAHDDMEFAAPFTPYRGAEAGGGASTGQFLGLAPPHFLEVDFDPAALPKSGSLRLLMTGWFYWTDASVNVASSATPGIEFVPPILEVPDGKGGWRPSGPPVGFPAGKVKTMVVDVTDVLDRADPRLRIATTLRLYWDSIRLATDAHDAPTKVTRVDVARAELSRRGFSEPVELPGAQGLAWFDWDRLSKEPRWNQHPGLYTRYGDVRELVLTVDDRLVVMGSGDALSLAFDAAGLPALPDGWSRDWLVYLDGWAKDRDPNTVEALYVEPLPFHGMSGYPYGPDEHAPDDEAHRRWRQDWETRPATRWIEPLAPARPR